MVTVKLVEAFNVNDKNDILTIKSSNFIS